MITDTERLDYLLGFILLTDVGDADFCPGVVVDQETMEDRLSFGRADIDGKAEAICKFGDDLRAVIDRAIAEHGM